MVSSFHPPRSQHSRYWPERLSPLLSRCLQTLNNLCMNEANPQAALSPSGSCVRHRAQAQDLFLPAQSTSSTDLARSSHLILGSMTPLPQPEYTNIFDMWRMQCRANVHGIAKPSGGRDNSGPVVSRTRRVNEWACNLECVGV